MQLQFFKLNMFACLFDVVSVSSSLCSINCWTAVSYVSKDVTMSDKVHNYKKKSWKNVPLMAVCISVKFPTCVSLHTIPSFSLYNHFSLAIKPIYFQKQAET